jgi:hypothetical protein
VHYAEILSTIALFISIASFGLSALSVFRDRPRVKVTSTFYAASDFNPDGIHVVVVNKGRRPVILRTVGGSGEGGGWSATSLATDKGGIRLGEHERWEHTIEPEHTVSINPEGEGMIFERMWIEDSLGNRHSIPRSREYVATLQSSLFAKRPVVPQESDE